MANKAVTVTLGARIDQYKRSMRDAKRSTDDFAKGSSRDLVQLGSSMQSIGKTATVGLTLPLVGVGAAAVEMSSEFDASMAKMVGLVGLSVAEVDGMREAVLGLAGETARSPQELADALFVVTSAGLRGEEALSTLEAAAKASAAGLGETADIARAVAGAVNAYGPDVLDAAHATDVLTATARAGNFETSQLAGALGKVLPFAKQAQTSFEDVGGAVALLTRTNGNASESITQVQALLRAFVVPTAEAQTALDGMGLSAEDVRDSIGEQGLVATLQMLDDKLGGNREQLGRMIGSSEGASAAFQILDADAAALEGTFGTTAKAAGMVGEAFSAMSETDQFKMQQALEQLTIAMIEVGAVIAPMVADVAGGVGDLAGAFSDLDPTIQKVVIGIAAAAAAAGPLLIVTGSLIRSYALLKTTMAASNMTMAGGAAKMGLLAKAAAVATVAYASLAPAIEGARGNTDFVYKDLQGLENLLLPMQQLGKLSYMLAGGTESAASKWSKFEEEAEGAFGAMTTGVYTMEQLGKRLDESSLSLEARNLIIIAFRKQLDLQAESEANLAEATAEAAEATDDQAESTEGATDATSRYITKAEQVQGALDGAIGSLAGVNDKYAEQVAAADAAREAQERYIESVLDGIASHFDYEKAALALGESYTDYVEMMAEGESSAIDMRQAEIDLAEQAYATSEALADEMGALEGSAEWAGIMASALEAQADKYPELREEIDQLIAKLGELPESRNVDINVTTYYRELGRSSTPVNVNRGGPRAGGGPTYPNTLHPVNEHGSELLTEGGRTYLMSSTHGMVTPLSPAGATASAAWGGQGDVIINTGPITTQARDGQQLLDEFNAAIRRQGPGATRRNLGIG